MTMQSLYAFESESAAGDGTEVHWTFVWRPLREGDEPIVKTLTPAEYARDGVKVHTAVRDTSKTVWSPQDIEALFA